MDKRLFLEQTIEKVREQDMAKIIGGYINLSRRSGRNLLGLCPFHNDQTVGSFVVTPNKGIFKCFACGVAGDSIKFVSLKRNINYVEAAFEIALNERVISNDEYEEYFKKRRYSKDEVANIEGIFTNLDKEKSQSTIASPEVLNVYFNKFLETLELTDRHEKYLIEERGLDKETIEERGYKSLVDGSVEGEKSLRLYDRFIPSIDMENGPLSKEVLENVPGFYEYSYNVKGVQKWTWTYARNFGIVIPIRNAEGLIVGLQIRRDEKDEDRGRYSWFSSTFANFDAKKFRKGTSAGSPLDVVYPKGRPSRVLFITEGRFKSEIIAQKVGSVSISVQGVGNWHNIDDEIKSVQKKLASIYPEVIETIGDEDVIVSPEFSFDRIYVAFDSDMRYKYQVYNQLEKMTNFIKTKYPELDLYYLNWEGKDKGIDDLFFNNPCNKMWKYGELLTVYEKKHWDEEYDKQLKTLLEREQIARPFDLPQEILKEIKIAIQVKNEKASA